MKLNILLLCNKPNEGSDANTISDHIDAIVNYSEHNVWLCSNIGDLSIKLDLTKFDVIIIHYSLSILSDYYLSRQAKRKLSLYNGLKVIYLQDEYRQIDKMINELNFLKIDVIFSCFPEHELERIYSSHRLPNVSKYTNLTGYIPERIANPLTLAKIADRPLHLGYRGRKLPFWYGELAYEKWSIVDNWMKYATRNDLLVDISYDEKDRIYGKKWPKFLSSCKATLGVESGASVMDFTGELEKTVDLHQLTYPKHSFQIVQEKYLSDHEGKYQLNQISPRCFEAIAMKTALVLYEGEYSGILIPGRHYLVLKKDFSNIEAVLACLRNDAFLQNMVDITFQEIALNPDYSYQHFMKNSDGIIASEFVVRQKKIALRNYTGDDFLHDIKFVSLKSKAFKVALPFYQKLPIHFRLIVRGFFRPKATLNAIFRRVISARPIK